MNLSRPHYTPAILRKTGLALAALAISAVSAQAQNQPNPQPQLQASVEPAATGFSLIAEAAISTNLRKTGTADKDVDSTFVFNPEYIISEPLTIGLQLKLIQKMTDYTDTLPQDSVLYLRKSAWILNPTLKLSPTLSLLIPTSIESRKVRHLNIGASLGNKLDITPASLPRLSGSYALGFSMYSYEYTTSNTGKSNPRFQIKNTVKAKFDLGLSFAFQAVGIHAIKYTYLGTPGSIFELSEELSYEVSKNFSFAIGHSNEGGAYKENGSDLNISIYNGNASTIYGSASLSL